jgi:hypothetical protein
MQKERFSEERTCRRRGSAAYLLSFYISGFVLGLHASHTECPMPAGAGHTRHRNTASYFGGDALYPHDKWIGMNRFPARCLSAIHARRRMHAPMSLRLRGGGNVSDLWWQRSCAAAKSIVHLQRVLQKNSDVRNTSSCTAEVVDDSTEVCLLHIRQALALPSMLNAQEQFATGIVPFASWQSARCACGATGKGFDKLRAQAVAGLTAFLKDMLVGGGDGEGVEGKEGNKKEEGEREGGVGGEVGGGSWSLGACGGKILKINLYSKFI